MSSCTPTSAAQGPRRDAFVAGSAIAAALAVTVLMVETLRCATLWLHGVHACVP
jgi:hypothetical protein